MSCERYESQMPAYLENDLPAAESAEVKQHLAGCASCREVVAGLRELDNLLAMRREEVPPVSRTVRAVMPRLGFSRTKRALDAMFSLPGIISMSFFIIAAVLFVYRRFVESLIGRDLPLVQFFTGLGETLTAGLMNVTGGDVWALTGLYAAVLLLIMLGTGRIVFKFMRSTT